MMAPCLSEPADKNAPPVVINMAEQKHNNSRLQPGYFKRNINFNCIIVDNRTFVKQKEDKPSTVSSAPYHMDGAAPPDRVDGPFLV
jgi:hypothetical protein